MKNEIVTFRETLSKDDVTPEKIASGYATERMKKVDAVKDDQGNIITPAKEEGTGVYEHKGQVTYNFPETIEEAMQSWGEAVCIQKMNQTVRIDVGKVAKAGETPEQSQKFADEYVPGVARKSAAGGVSMKAIMEALKLLPEDQRKAILDAAGIKA